MKKIFKKPFYYIVVLGSVSEFVFNCAPMYRIRSPEEIEELSQEIAPMPDSLLTIPDFNGVDTIPIFYFETHNGWGLLTRHMIYNDGKYEFMQQKRGMLITENIKISDIRNLLSDLNQMGFFSISNESIQKKKFIEYRGCCLGLFFGGLPYETVCTDATTHTVEIELSNIKHSIACYDIAYHMEIYPTLQDLQILWKSIAFIEVFLAGKRAEMYN